ncbi:MAG: hypothetical protein GC191_11890 [Azospirillum sp.]|nr:hypothetical protein [Azospirillum sp.]
MPQHAEPAAEKTVYLGLAMSGAISAGAYSAGVLDFLIEALEEWEKEKRRKPGDPTIPRHQVVIAGMSGASAGAITCAMGALSAAFGARPAGAPRNAKASDPDQAAFHVLPELYGAWVRYPTFFEESEVGTLLGTDDVDALIAETATEKMPPVTSVLNSKPLSEIGQRVMEQIRTAASAFEPRPYFPQRLHLFLTQTNSRGIPYAIEVKSDQGTSEYGMMCHLDRAHFTLAGLGTAQFDSRWAGAEQSYRFDVVNRGSAPPQGFESLWTEQNTKTYIENTLASGAYPIGLEARDLMHPLDHYRDRVWPVPAALEIFKGIKPYWPWRSGMTPEVYRFTALDGGAIDNDPFQFVRYTLMAEPPKDSPGATDQADRMVIMISPFPEPPEIGALPASKSDKRLSKVAAGLSKIFIQQSRFKLDEMIRTLSSGDAGLWRISPRRSSGGVNQKFAIACGLYGGFGGFLARRFRDHDYELGRRNCQGLLNSWFGLPKTNPHIDAVMPMPQLRSPGSVPAPAEDTTALYPIIPLYGSASIEVQVRDWPTIDAKHYRGFLDQIFARGEKFFELIKKISGIDNWIKRSYLSIGLWGTDAGSGIRRVLTNLILGDLVRRDQILTEQQRQILEVCMATKLTPWLVAHRIVEQRPADATPVMTVKEIYGEIKNIQQVAPREFLDDLIAKVVGLTPEQVETILEADTPHYRTVDSITDELSANAPVARSEVAVRVKELVDLGILLVASGWDPVGRRWPSLRLFGPATVDAYRFVGREDGSTCL